MFVWYRKKGLCIWISPTADMYSWFMKFACLLLHKNQQPWEICIHKIYHDATGWKASPLCFHSWNILTAFRFLRMWPFVFCCDITCFPLKGPNIWVIPHFGVLPCVWASTNWIKLNGVHRTRIHQRDEFPFQGLYVEIRQQIAEWI